MYVNQGNAVIQRSTDTYDSKENKGDYENMIKKLEYGDIIIDSME